MEMLLEYEKIKQEQTNFASRTQAIGWAQLFNSFGSENKVNPIDLLPYSESVKSSSRVSYKTKRIILSLLDEERLSPFLLANLLNILD